MTNIGCVRFTYLTEEQKERLEQALPAQIRRAAQREVRRLAANPNACPWCGANTTHERCGACAWTLKMTAQGLAS